MRLKFNGIKTQVKRSGCMRCHHQQTSSYGFLREKTLYLPSGVRQSFQAGKMYDLSRTDGQFLLRSMASHLPCFHKSHKV